MQTHADQAGWFDKQTNTSKKMFPARGKSSHYSSSQESTTLSLYSLLELSVFQVFYIKGFKMSMDLDAPVPFAAPQEAISAT
jgi:hypothetical protein